MKVDSLGQCLQVGDALLQGVLLLLGRDRLAHVADDPVDHVSLLGSPHDVADLELVVEPLLDLKIKQTL